MRKILFKYECGKKGVHDNSFRMFIVKHNLNFIITQAAAKKKQLVLKTERFYHHCSKQHGYTF